MPILMKANFQISLPLSCFHLHHFKLQNADNIQLPSISLQSAGNIQGFSQPLSGYQEKPCCTRDFFNPSNGCEVFCPSFNNAFGINTIEELADLCLESKTKFFFKNHTESSDEGELLHITQNVSETKGNMTKIS